MNRSDFISAVLNVMTGLSSYNNCLTQSSQNKMVYCFYKHGLLPKSVRQSIVTLTICTLEMQEVMVKLLPRVLLNLSKVSATERIAVPILEFLSSEVLKFV